MEAGCPHPAPAAQGAVRTRRLHQSIFIFLLCQPRWRGGLLRKSNRSVAIVMMGHPNSPHPAQARLLSPGWRGARAVLS
jgi:hypothetical protein